MMQIFAFMVIYSGCVFGNGRELTIVNNTNSSIEVSNSSTPMGSVKALRKMQMRKIGPLADVAGTHTWHNFSTSDVTLTLNSASQKLMTMYHIKPGENPVCIQVSMSASDIGSSLLVTPCP